MMDSGKNQLRRLGQLASKPGKLEHNNIHHPRRTLPSGVGPARHRIASTERSRTAKSERSLQAAIVAHF